MDITCINCGSINDYTVRATELHNTAFCNGCSKYIKHLPKEKPLVIHFGKYKGTALSDFTSKDQVSWLNWLLNNGTNVKPYVIDQIKKHLGYETKN